MTKNDNSSNKKRNYIPSTLQFLINRSSCPEVFCKRVFLKISQKFLGKHLCQSLFFKNGSVKSESGFSLNDCLENGPELQKKLWDILVRTRFRPLVTCRDIKKAFLQIRIKENERHCLRFHLSEKANYDVIKTYRFTRFVFGLNQSPFIL